MTDRHFTKQTDSQLNIYNIYYEINRRYRQVDLDNQIENQKELDNIERQIDRWTAS